MNIRKNNLNVQNPSFSGHKKTMDKFGYDQHKFYYLYDSAKYDCELELYNISKDKHGNISKLEASSSPAVTIPMRDGGITADLTDFDELNLKDGFAYRFKLTSTDKEKTVSYGFDNGSVIGIFEDEPENKFNVVLSNRATINKNGPMQLIMPDEYYPGVDKIKDAEGRYQVDPKKRADAEKAVRTHANKLGGQFIGIIKRLPDIKNEGVKRIVGTPFTRDTISSHLYWTENAYQVAPSLGTEKEFKELLTELFKNGINWVADAALVNEGFGGIHLSEVLRKGPDATSKNMFRSDERISLGILPDKAGEKGFTRMKMINAPFVVDGSSILPNESYNAKKPTYVQFYDERLASDEQKLSQSPSRLATYDIKNTDNVYDITSHDDAVYPFPLEVSPIELERNIRRELESDNASGIFDTGYPNTIKNVEAMKRITEFSNFNVVHKEKAGGLEVWDGNVDIAKLNFYKSRQDDARFIDIRPSDRAAAVEAFERGALAVRDYAVNSGKYWTQLAADTQMEYISKYLADNRDKGDYMTIIEKGIKEGALPEITAEVVDGRVVRNVQRGKYNLRRLTELDKRSDLAAQQGSNVYTTREFVMKKAMDLPLEALPVAVNLLGILTSPYLAKKANVEEELGITRFDLSSVGNPNLPEEYRATYEKMEEVYANIATRIDAVIADIDGVEDANGNLTEKGRYIISEITPDLTKYMFIKALSPESSIKVDDNGNFDFSSVKAEDITMQSLGVTYGNMTSYEEADRVVTSLQKGIEKNLSPESLTEIKEYVEKRFENRNLDDYRIAEMIIDRTESGLGWRIDAAKDIASIDAVRSGVDSLAETWDKVIDFWELYNQAVLRINPHAYTTAEITDLPDLFNGQDTTKYKSSGDAERKFLEKTGITSIANYNYFFSLMPALFSNYGFENGDKNGKSPNADNYELLEKLDTGWEHHKSDNPGFLFNSPDDGVKNSYTFFGNHDKPRAIHCLALDMGLFSGAFDKDAPLARDYKTAQDTVEKLSKMSQDELKAKNLEWQLNAAKRVTAQHQEHVKIAEQFFGEYKPEPFEWDLINTKALAMGARLKEAFYSVGDFTSDEKKALDKALAELALGSHKGTDFDPTAFGTRSFEIAIDTVFEQMKYNGTEFTKDVIEAKKAEILKSILVPAFDRYASMYKLLISLPGSPTDFAGDRVGASGHETKAKNYRQQNRNTIHWEWLQDPKYSYIMDFYKEINDIAGLRSSNALSALNDGDTITVPVDVPGANDGKGVSRNVQTMLRYNDKGSVVLSFHDITGAEAPLTKVMSRGDGKVISQSDNRIYFLSVDNSKRGLKHGLPVGTVFKNALDLNDKGNSVEYVVGFDKNKGYYLEKKEITGYNPNGMPIWQTQPIKIEARDKNSLVLCKVRDKQ